MYANNVVNEALLDILYNFFLITKQEYMTRLIISRTIYSAHFHKITT